jgi:hypothetical protein
MPSFVSGGLLSGIAVMCLVTVPMATPKLWFFVQLRSYFSSTMSAWLIINESQTTIAAPRTAKNMRPNSLREAPFGTAAGAPVDVAAADDDTSLAAETVPLGDSVSTVVRVVMDPLLNKPLGVDEAAVVIEPSVPAVDVRALDAGSVEVELGWPPSDAEATAGVEASAELDTDAGVRTAAGLAELVIRNP